MTETETGTGSWEWALSNLKQGCTAHRDGWNGADGWIEIIAPPEGSCLTAPFIVYHSSQGEVIPWLASQADQLATDWVVNWRSPIVETYVATAGRLTRQATKLADLEARHKKALGVVEAHEKTISEMRLSKTRSERGQASAAYRELEDTLAQTMAELEQVQTERDEAQASFTSVDERMYQTLMFLQQTETDLRQAKHENIALAAKLEQASNRTAFAESQLMYAEEQRDYYANQLRGSNGKL